MAEPDHENSEHSGGESDGSAGLKGEGNGGMHGGDQGDGGNENSASSSIQNNAGSTDNFEGSQEGNEAPQSPLQEHMAYKAFDGYADLPSNLLGTPDFKAVRLPGGGYYSPGKATDIARQGDTEESGEFAPLAKPVRDWMLQTKVVDPESSYISGIPSSVWNSLSSATQEEYKRRFDSGYSTPIGAVGSFAQGELFREATLMGRFGLGVANLYAGAVYDKMNAPLEEHPGKLYANLLDRAASGYYD